MCLQRSSSFLGSACYLLKLLKLVQGKTARHDSPEGFQSYCMAEQVILKGIKFKLEPMIENNDLMTLCE